MHNNKNNKKHRIDNNTPLVRDLFLENTDFINSTFPSFSILDVSGRALKFNRSLLWPSCCLEIMASRRQYLVGKAS